MKLLLLVLLIFIIIFIVIYKNKESFYSNKEEVLIDKGGFNIENVIINNSDNIGNVVNNDVSMDFVNNSTEAIDSSSIFWNGVLNIPKNTNILVGGEKLNAQTIRDYKKNTPCELKFSDTSIMGNSYPASTKGLWINAKIDNIKEADPKMLDINQSGSTDTEKIINIGGSIQENVYKNNCLKSSPKNKFNKYYNDSTLKGIEYPGCDSYCCSPSPLSEQKTIVYDELCIGDTCINGENLKILKGDRMMGFKSDVNDKCLSYPSNQINISANWPNKTQFLTDSNCKDSPSNDNMYYQIYPKESLDVKIKMISNNNQLFIEEDNILTQNINALQAQQQTMNNELKSYENSVNSKLEPGLYTPPPPSPPSCGGFFWDTCTW
jgi:hypothetical protein